MKLQVCGTDSSPPSSAEVKEREELYLYSPSLPELYLLYKNLMCFVQFFFHFGFFHWQKFNICIVCNLYYSVTVV